jgi:glucosamine kinase
MPILIAESGSSKTDWRFIDSSDKIHQIKSLGINPFFQDEDSIICEIRDKVVPNISESVTDIYYYGTGITNPAMADVIKRALTKNFIQAKIEIHDDMVAAARALCLNEPGIACILGTGSNSCLYDGQKITEKVPALGFWLGDEGSGGYLGKQLIIKYIRKELPADIEEKFIKRFGKLERTEILEKAYKQPFPNRYFAGFSKFLFDNRSHPFIFQIVFDAFQVFLEKNVCQYPNFKNYKTHFTGSIAFYYSDILRKVASHLGITVGVIMESPIAGLVLYHKKGA